MATIRITNLRLKTIIGANDWERKIRQKVIINIAIDFDASKAAKTDKLKDTLDYKKVTKEIIRAVEKSRFHLLEKLSATILELIMANKQVQEATVRVDKPAALRFSDSVSVEMVKSRDK